MAETKKKDPTISSESVTAFPEGTHPAVSPSDVTHSASRIKYREADDKPDPSSVAQVADIPGDFPGQ